MMGKTLHVALVQFDAVPEKTKTNLTRMTRLARQAAADGAELIMFHEGTITDYTPRVEELSELVPEGPSCRRVERLARELGVYISFGLGEADRGFYYITQAFMAPHGFLYSYRKTWLHGESADEGYRNEHARYDPGRGPGLFEIAGVRATCFICADGEAPRCVERARLLKPQLVFYPNNRSGLPDFGKRARRIGAPMLVTNRVGKSWAHGCSGGCAVYGADGKLLAAANCEGREEILHHVLKLP